MKKARDDRALDLVATARRLNELASELLEITLDLQAHALEGCPEEKKSSGTQTESPAYHDMDDPIEKNLVMPPDPPADEPAGGEG